MDGKRTNPAGDFTKLERYVMSQATMLKRMAGQLQAMETRCTHLQTQVTTLQNELSRVRFHAR